MESIDTIKNNYAKKNQFTSYDEMAGVFLTHIKYSESESHKVKAFENWLKHSEEILKQAVNAKLEEVNKFCETSKINLDESDDINDDTTYNAGIITAQDIINSLKIK